MTPNQKAFYECSLLVYRFFGGNWDKSQEWWRTKNPSLGGVTPETMVNSNKADRLLMWIKGQIELNEASRET